MKQSLITFGLIAAGALAPQVGCPVLVAWSTRDRFLQLRRNRPAIRSFPDARLETFAAGHAAHLETPDEFEAALEAFLDRLAKKAGERSDASLSAA